MNAAPILFLTPSAPMVFMGDEWFSNDPFHFFCALNDITEDTLLENRQREFPLADFNSPSPMSGEAFAQSKLNWRESKVEKSAKVIRFVQELIALRRQHLWPFLSSGISHHEIVNDQAENRLQLQWINTNGEEWSLTVSTADIGVEQKVEESELIFSNDRQALSSNGAPRLSFRLKRPNTAMNDYARNIA